MNEVLTDEQVSHFHEMGYVKNIPVLDASALDVARSDVELFTQELTAEGLTHNDVNGWWAPRLLHVNSCNSMIYDSVIRDDTHRSADEAFYPAFPR